MILGIFLVVVCALGGVLWSISSESKRPAVALRHDIKRGAVVKADDLRVVEIATDAQLATVAVADASSIIGKTSIADLPGGTDVTPQLVSSARQIPAGRSIVGLRLEVGEYPSTALHAGDSVDVITTAKPGEATADRAGDGDVLVRAAQVSTWSRTTRAAGSSR